MSRQQRSEEQAAEEQTANQQREEKEAEPKGEEEEEAPPPTIVEWSVRIASILLLLVLVGYVAWEGTQPDAPVTFGYSPQWEQLEQTSEGKWRLPVEIENRGDHSVMNLLLSAELTDAQNQPVEEAEVSIPLLGRGESSTVDLWFNTDPTQHTLTFNEDSYTRR